ncbi:MAG: twin-arginine translocase subunit TatC [Candidatus Sumerlaeia bacterium]
MGILEHLEELRTRLILSICFLVGGCVVGFFLAKPVVNILVRPFSNIKIERNEKVMRIQIEGDRSLRLVDEPTSGSLQDASPYRLYFYLPGSEPDGEPDFVWGQTLKKPIFLNPLDPITLFFKAALIVGLIISLPLVLWQVWIFVAPGLLEGEKRTAQIMLGCGAVLFPIGATFAYFMFGVILNFLMNFQIMSLEPQLEIFRFVNLELRLMIAFGVVFELPLVVMFLTFLGILNPPMLRKYRAHVIVGLGVVAMLFTPPDPISMLLMMGPLIILYEISIWASVPLARKHAQKLKEEEEELDS